jgi:iron complex outermembrane receptor protein
MMFLSGTREHPTLEPLFMYKQPGILALGFFVLTCPVVAQQRDDSVRVLNEVVVAQSRLSEYAVGSYRLTIDSTTMELARSGSLADLLRRQGYGHVRSYGPGGLALPSFRGTGGNHTAVLWNGISVLSPLTGQTDLSQLSSTLFDHASIVTGGGASLAGSGALGATINLSNNFQFNQGTQASLHTTFGSFGTFFPQANVSISSTRFGSTSRVFSQVAENDFRFVNNTTNPPEEQERLHNAFSQWGFVQQFYYQASSRSLLSARFWYQESAYEVPNPITVLRPGEAVEDNKTLRTLLGWNYSLEHLEFNYQGAFIHHDLLYTDPLLALSATNRYTSSIHNAELTISVQGLVNITSGVNYTWEQAVVDDFGTEQPVRNRLALFSAMKMLTHDRWNASLAFRQEVADGVWAPFAPSLSCSYKISGTTHVYGNASRNYRIPTFNELYWKGSGISGNPDLKPELSVGGDVGVNVNHVLGNFKVAAFSNWVDNWILWSPESGQSWQAINVKQVWARGVEFQGNLQRPVHDWLFEMSGMYSYTRSTNEKMYGGAASEQGKQLMMVPRHEGSAQIRISHSGYSLQWVTSVTGKQYTDTDNTEFNAMPAYTVSGVWLSKAWSMKRTTVSIIGEVNNLFNADYVSRPGYPMPWINYKGTLVVTFITPKNP